MSQPNRVLIWMLGFLILIGLAAAALFVPLRQAFGATPIFNGVIIAVFLVGVAVNLRHVLRLQREVRWIEALKRSAPDTRLEPPVLLAPMAKMFGKSERKPQSLSTASMRSMLDSIYLRLEEQRDTGRWDLASDRLSLAPLVPLVQQLAPLPEPAREWLQALRPEGQLRNIQLSYQPDAEPAERLRYTLNLEGVGFAAHRGVPAAAGELRILTQNAISADGYWYHVDYKSGGAQGTFVFLNGVKKLTLPRWPGGFAYVPAGSPGFDEQALIVAEWRENSVATYSVDDQGDPIPSTRKPFFNTFPRPWGAYFEPVAGDYLFLTWRAQEQGISVPDRIVVVAGFKPPPPPPTEPPPK